MSMMTNDHEGAGKFVHCRGGGGVDDGQGPLRAPFFHTHVVGAEWMMGGTPCGHPSSTHVVGADPLRAPFFHTRMQKSTHMCKNLTLTYAYGQSYTKGTVSFGKQAKNRPRGARP